jgi:hypothetical protein
VLARCCVCGGGGREAPGHAHSGAKHKQKQSHRASAALGSRRSGSRHAGLSGMFSILSLRSHGGLGRPLGSHAYSGGLLAVGPASASGRGWQHRRKGFEERQALSHPGANESCNPVPARRRRVV